MRHLIQRSECATGLLRTSLYPEAAHSICGVPALPVVKEQSYSLEPSVPAPHLKSRKQIPFPYPDLIGQMREIIGTQLGIALHCADYPTANLVRGRQIVLSTLVPLPRGAAKDNINLVASRSRKRPEWKRYLRDRRLKAIRRGAPGPPEIRASFRLPKVAVRHFAPWNQKSRGGIRIRHGGTAEGRFEPKPAGIENGPKPASLAAVQGIGGATYEIRFFTAQIPCQFLEWSGRKRYSTLESRKHLTSERLQPHLCGGRPD